jgi:hypothetical protein
LVGATAQPRGWTIAAGFLVAVCAGALTGALFGVVTRSLRRYAPVLVWSLLFFPAAWTAFHAYVLRGSLPFLPLVAGALAFGIGVSFQVPLRVRTTPPWMRE